jgi:hypothetical protein
LILLVVFPLRPENSKKSKKIVLSDLLPQISCPTVLVSATAIAAVGNPTVGFTRSEGGTDKTAELSEGMDGTRKSAW